MRKNSEKDWIPQSNACINEARPEGAGNTDEPLDIRTCEGGPTMPVKGNITACGDSTSEHTPNNWKSVAPLEFEVTLRAHDREIARGIKGWPVSKQVRAAIYTRDNNACYYCRSPFNLSLDHKVPQVFGGSSHSHNLVTCCKSCNSAKGCKFTDEFIAFEGARQGAA